jgi:hypothetical protein
MRICIIGLFLVAMSVGASAQQDVLVPAAPVYLPGETYVGKAYVPDFKITAELRQSAFPGKDGEMYMEVDTVLANGDVVERATVNLTTGLATNATRTRTSTAISTTCTRASLFPVYIGAQGDCTSIDNVNGREVISAIHWEFVNASRDVDGNILSICHTLTSDKVVEYICSTSDMKWVRFMTVTFR